MRTPRIRLGHTGDATGIIAISGNAIGNNEVKINYGQAPYIVEPLEFEIEIPRLDDVSSLPPSEWLTARNAVIPFRGRVGELSTLAGWRDADTVRSIQLIHGAGGQGKSRLASQFARNSSFAGWHIMQATYNAYVREEVDVPEGDTEADRLILVDYAERWPHADLIRFIRSYAGENIYKVRILLLSRSGGAWWTSLKKSIRDAGYTQLSLDLAPLAQSTDERMSIFREAGQRFNRMMDVPLNRPIGPIGDLEHSAYQSVLSIHMAALVAVDAEAYGRQKPTDPGVLSSYLLDREFEHWAAMENSGRLHISAETMARLVTVATILGPLPPPAAQKALVALELASSVNEAIDLLDQHARCYPGSVRQVMSPLSPNRLGEDFIASRISEDYWCNLLPQRILLSSEFDSLHQHAWTIVVETAARWPDVVACVDAIITEDTDRIYAMGNGPLSLIAKILPVSTLELIETSFPSPRNVKVDLGVAEICQRLTDHRLGVDVPPERNAELCRQLSTRLAWAGLEHRALQYSGRAVVIWRMLSQRQPTKLVELAAALNSHSWRLSAVREFSKALEASAESVGILRRIRHVAASIEETYSISLNNLSVDLYYNGKVVEALDSALEAFEIRGRLAPEDEATLALVSNNIGLWMSSLGKPQAEEYLRASEQRYSRLASKSPDIYSPDHWKALFDLASEQYRLNKLVEAAHSCDKALAIIRTLSRFNPSQFSSQLGDTLVLSSKISARSGKFSSGLTTMSEALDIIDRDGGEWSDIAAEFYLEIGDEESALDFAKNNVDKFRSLFYENPRRYRRAYAESLSAVGVVFTKLGRPNDALVATQKAVDVQRESIDNIVDKRNFITLLDNLAVDLREVGEASGAASRVSEAVSLCEEIYLLHPEFVGFQYASILHQAALALLEAEDYEEAGRLVTQSLTLLKTGYMLGWDEYRLESALVYWLQSRLEILNGQMSLAILSARESVSILLTLSLRTSDMQRKFLTALDTLLALVGESSEVEEIVSSILDRNAGRPEDPARGVGLCYLVLAEILFSSADEEGGLAAERLSIESEFMEYSPACHPPGISKANRLNHRGFKALRDGRREVARKFLVLSVTYYRLDEDHAGELMALENVFESLREDGLYDDAANTLLDILNCLVEADEGRIYARYASEIVSAVSMWRNGENSDGAAIQKTLEVISGMSLDARVRFLVACGLADGN
ncbi:tetratricopeptide repeat protein [Nocardia aurea]|uniref:Tetratricopeptide repeat protein n=1 Tax=Nocardia aurea TaxID=2144174 RepID=A0ABV3FYA6_9NOCA